MGKTSFLACRSGIDARLATYVCNCWIVHIHCG